MFKEIRSSFKSNVLIVCAFALGYVVAGGNTATSTPEASGTEHGLEMKQITEAQPARAEIQSQANSDVGVGKSCSIRHSIALADERYLVVCDGEKWILANRSDRTQEPLTGADR